MTDATKESLLAGVELLIAALGVAFPVVAPEAAAAVAGLKAIAAHGNGETDAATMMARITDVRTQFAALDAEEAALDKAKFPT